MALSFRQLQIFCAVARCGSTTAAAESISLSQSATSAALNELESQLSTRLFDRVGKRLQLNEVGRRFLPQALRLLDGVAQLEQQFAVSAAPQASLTVAASSTIGNYVLPRLLASFEREQPGVRVNASIGNTGSAVQDVVTFAADIGLIEGPCHEPGLRVEPWLEDSLIVVAAPGHPLALRTQVSREALRRARWLLREPGSGTREEVSHALLGHLHYLEDSLDLGSSEAIKHSVAAGLGISCLSRWVVEEQLASGALVELRSSLPPLRGVSTCCASATSSSRRASSASGNTVGRDLTPVSRLPAKRSPCRARRAEGDEKGARNGPQCESGVFRKPSAAFRKPLEAIVAVSLAVELAENDLPMSRRDSPLAGSDVGSAESMAIPIEGAAAMMHADLIDQDDFRERLQALGFSVPPDSTPEQACEYAVRGLSPERAQALRRLVEDMLGGHATLLPAVREAISRQLLPALVPRG